MQQTNMSIHAVNVKVRNTFRKALMSQEKGLITDAFYSVHTQYTAGVHSIYTIYGIYILYTIYSVYIPCSAVLRSWDPSCLIHRCWCLPNIY